MLQIFLFSNFDKITEIIPNANIFDRLFRFFLYLILVAAVVEIIILSIFAFLMCNKKVAIHRNRLFKAKRYAISNECEYAFFYLANTKHISFIVKKFFIDFARLTIRVFRLLSFETNKSKKNAMRIFQQTIRELTRRLLNHYFRFFSIFSTLGFLLFVGEVNFFFIFFSVTVFVFGYTGIGLAMLGATFDNCKKIAKKNIGLKNCNKSRIMFLDFVGDYAKDICVCICSLSILIMYAAAFLVVL